MAVSLRVIEHGRAAPVAEPCARPAHEVLRDLGVARDRGLAVAEVRERRRRYGTNRLFNVTEHPTAGWTARQLVEACGLEGLDRFDGNVLIMSW